MATLIATPKELKHAFEFLPGDSAQEYDERSNKAFDQLHQVADSLADGEVVGALIQFPYADGCAFYRVASAKPLKLQHIPFADAWAIDAATIRGLRLTDVESMVQRARAYRKLFKAV